MKSRLRILISLLLIALIAVFSISNKAAVAKSDSSEISYEEKLKKWNSFSEEKKAKIRKIAREMSEQKFKTLKSNYKKLKTFEPQEQKRIKENFNRFKGFRQQKRKQIRRNFKRFKNFKPQRRQQLRQKYGKRFGRQGILPGQRRRAYQRHNNQEMRKMGPGNSRQNNLRNKIHRQNLRQGSAFSGQRKNRPANRQLNNRNEPRQQRPGRHFDAENNKKRQMRKAPASNIQGFQRNEQQFQRKNERSEINRFRRNFGDFKLRDQRRKSNGANRRWADVQKFREGISEAYKKRRRTDPAQNEYGLPRPRRSGERPVRRQADRQNQRREQPNRAIRQGKRNFRRR